MLYVSYLSEMVSHIIKTKEDEIADNILGYININIVYEIHELTL